MANIKTAYGTQGQTITCSLASLANGSARESNTIDNRTNLWLDALVVLQIKTGAGTIGSDQLIYCYVWGTVDDGTTLPDTVTGSDANITLDSPGNLKLLGTMFTGAVSHTYKAGPWSVAQAFGGTMPAEWGIVIVNRTGVSLDSTEGNHKKLYQGVYSTVT